MLIVLAAVALTILPPIAAFSATDESILGISTPNGALRLGMTKKQVVSLMGKPNSPQDYDFVYSKGNGEVIVAFEDDTKKVGGIIVRGITTKYSVAGIIIGDGQEKVINKLGKAEKTTKVDNGKAECWYYPAKNVYFCIDGNQKVTSFGVSNCCKAYMKKQK